MLQADECTSGFGLKASYKKAHILAGSWVVTVTRRVMSPNIGYKYSYPTYTPGITTHEPRSNTDLQAALML